MTKHNTDRLKKFAPAAPADVSAGSAKQPIFHLSRHYLWKVALLITRCRSTLHLSLEDEVVLGRLDTSAATNTCIDLTPFGAVEEGVSRRHLSIKLQGEQVFVIDHHSTNGSVLNGIHLDPEVPYVLNDGDILLLGNFELHVQLIKNPFV